MDVNIFETRFLTELVMQRKSAKSFLRNTFFNAAPTIFKTRTVDFPLWDGVRRLAYYTGRNAPSQQVNKIGYKTQSITPSLISLSDSTNVSDLLKVLPGEVIQYTPTSPREDAILKLADQYAILDDMVARAEEYQARQILFDARTDFYDIQGNPTEESVVYDRDTANAIGTGGLVGGTWTNATNARPLDDLDLIRRIIQKGSGEVADIAIMGETAWKDFHNTTQVKERWTPMAFLQNDPFIRQMQEDGGIFRGMIEGYKIFTYDDWYRDDQTTGKPLVEFVPKTKVLIGASQAKTAKLYGAVDLIPADQINGQAISQLFAAPRVADSYTRKDPDQRVVRLQSAPLLAARQPNAYGVLTVE